MDVLRLLCWCQNVRPDDLSSISTETERENLITLGLIKRHQRSDTLLLTNSGRAFLQAALEGDVPNLTLSYHGAADGRIHIDFSIHAEYTCKSHIVKAYSDLCREKGGRMHIHLAETAREQRECIERYGKTPTEWFESLGTFDSPSAAHCVAVTERDMDILKAHGVSVIHNPTSNLKLGSGFAPIRQMMDKGINVTLGTDGTASNNNLNMFEEMHLAEIMHDGYHNDPTLISTQEVLDMATVNGAKLQGRDDTGVLAVGKKADIIAIDLSKPHLYPNFDTPALLTCSAQAGDVCMTMVDGNILYENGEFKTLDENKVRADMERAVERLYRK